MFISHYFRPFSVFTAFGNFTEDQNLRKKDADTKNNKSLELPKKPQQHNAGERPEAATIKPCLAAIVLWQARLPKLAR